MTDLINRADAIGAVHEYYQKRFTEDSKWNADAKMLVLEDKTIANDNMEICNIIKALPSANAVGEKENDGFNTCNNNNNNADVDYKSHIRLIGNAPSADAVPQSEQYKKGFEDAKRAILVEYARESENMRKRNAQFEVMLNAQKAISAEAVSREEYEETDAEWIPCSERLPKAEDMYQPPEQRYLCQLEAHGVRKFCVLSRLKGAVSPFWDWYGIAVYDSEVTAWMPLPKPYREEREDYELATEQMEHDAMYEPTYNSEDGSM